MDAEQLAKDEARADVFDEAETRRLLQRPAADLARASQQLPIDWPAVLRGPLLFRVGATETQVRARIVRDLLSMSVLAGRHLTREEMVAAAEHRVRVANTLTTAPPIALGLTALGVYRSTRADTLPGGLHERFAYDRNVFWSRRFMIAEGARARRLWMMTRITIFLAGTALFVPTLVTTYAETVQFASVADDPRLNRYRKSLAERALQQLNAEKPVDRLAQRGWQASMDKRRAQIERIKTQRTDGDDDGDGGDGGDDTEGVPILPVPPAFDELPEDGQVARDAARPDGYTQQTTRYEQLQTQFRQAEKTVQAREQAVHARAQRQLGGDAGDTPDGLGLGLDALDTMGDDDMSPIAAQHRTKDTGSGSAWDRVRAQAGRATQAAKSAPKTTDSDLDDGDYERQAREDARAYKASAQDDFDAMLERERQGKTDEKRW